MGVFVAFVPQIYVDDGWANGEEFEVNSQIISRLYSTQELRIQFFVLREICLVISMWIIRFGCFSGDNLKFAAISVVLPRVNCCKHVVGFLYTHPPRSDLLSVEVTKPFSLMN